MRALTGIAAGGLLASTLMATGVQPAAAVDPGATPGAPTPFVVAGADLGPGAGEHPGATCYPDAPLDTARVGDRTLLLAACSERRRVFATFLDAEGSRVEPWALIGTYADPWSLFVRDVAVDPETLDVGVVLGLGFDSETLGLARYQASSATWTSLSEEQASTGAVAACVDHGGVGTFGVGAAMVDGTLVVVGAGVATQWDETEERYTGTAFMLQARWDGDACLSGPERRTVVLATGVDLARAVDDYSEGRAYVEVSQLAGAPRALVGLNRPNGTQDWTDDVAEVVSVDLGSDTVSSLVPAWPGRIVGIDVVERVGSGSALVTQQPQGAGARLVAVPLDGSSVAVVPGTYTSLAFVEPDPWLLNPTELPFGYENYQAVARTAALLPESSTVTFAGAGDPDLSAGTGPRAPIINVGWHEPGQPGGLRSVAAPTSADGDPVHWRIRDVTRMSLVVVDDVPVFTAPCTVDSTATLWHCVSTWSSEAGWSAPEPVRRGVVPGAVVSVPESPVLVAAVGGGLRVVVRDTAAPTIDSTLDTEIGAPLTPDAVVSGTLVADDAIDRGELDCLVSLNGVELARSTIPLYDPDAAFPSPPTAGLTLQWQTPALPVGEYSVEASCADRAGNRTEEVLAAFSVAEPLAAPAAVTGLTGRSGNASVWVRWVGPAPTPGRAPHDGFRVEVEVGDSLVRTLTYGADISSAVIGDLANGAAHTVRVVATSQAHGDSASAEVHLRPLAPPSSVQSFRLLAGDGKVIARWAPPVRSPERAAPAAYRVDVVPAGGSGRKTYLVSRWARGRVIPGLTNGVTYSVRVVPLSAKGQGEASLWLNARPTRA